MWGDITTRAEDGTLVAVERDIDYEGKRLGYISADGRFALYDAKEENLLPDT